MKHLLCDHKSIMQGTASPNMYEKVKKIAEQLGMTQIKERVLKSGRIQFRYELVDDGITAWATPQTSQVESREK